MLLAAGGAPLFAASLFSQGQDAMRANDPLKARSLFQAALNEDPQNEELFVDLGVVDMQLGALEDAITIMKQGLSIAQTRSDALYFNLGNVYFMQSQNSLADGMYTNAIQKNPKYADAYLNRANARMRLQSYDGAASDYQIYLTLRPDSPQRAAIEQVLGLLTQAKAQAQAAQQAAEQKKQEEEARQKALLNAVMQQLQSASSDTTNLQAGNAPIQDTKPNLGLDD